ncbi:DegT/DnrJ/EryC1/StrS family aminotransferase [Fulvivirga lutea]|uniref:DegT/DnrJ/EryC1/StrS family aminotransferase n=1 Tax=Fulvivirga lutea TaxID=2810512 RepID=A0A975A0G3_9BACT|nr:DegT/DnrJ/EryC1/StrS family aminotransferase [Fulvivirga lutea]QSE96791.1 DegT/DnrJ/EryC1/StrS family aminotransferase [Fulvivirga lutea]
MKKIQMVDLISQYNGIKTEIDSAIQEVLDSASYINGYQVSQFAANLAEYLNVKHVIPCGNGTDAIQIALMALDLKPGDEVIVPVHTYVATAEAIALLKLKPVFVDVNEDDFTLNVNYLNKVLTSKTKAIVPVHLYGQCANMQPIMSFASANKIAVIEDAAQAIGADFISKYKENQKAGTIGDIGTTSFFPSKNLGCFGDGGALLTNNKELAEKCKLIANHGQKKKYHHDIIGCNSRLDTLQAAILDVKLKYLDDYIKKRQEVANKYDEEFCDIDGISIPFRSEHSTHVFHQYTIRIEKNRDLIKKKLAEAGIPTMIYYPIPLHLQRAYIQEDKGNGTFPVTERLSATVLSLPIHTEMVEEEQKYIIENFIKILTQING